MPHSPLTPALVVLLILVIGCAPVGAGQATPSDVTPTPPTDVPATGVVEHDASYPPLDFSGGRFVSVGRDGEVYLIDRASGEAEQLTDDGRRKGQAVISGTYVAWVATEHIYVLDTESGETQRITETYAERSGLAISGHRLVWADNRNEVGEHYTHADIYSYDIRSGQEQAIAIAPGSQRNPSIHGDLVVWQDNRNSPALGTVKAGCSNCPDNRYDIYVYDFTTGEEVVLAEGDFLQARPSVHGNYVVWEDFRHGWASDIYLVDLTSGEERRLTMDDDAHTSPAAYGDYVLWHVRSACDVFPQRDNTGVFLHDLSDGTTRQISDYVEPRATLAENVVTVAEGCWGTERVYSILLD